MTTDTVTIMRMKAEERRETFAAWSAAIQERLREGEATTSELHAHLGERADGRFWNWLRQSQKVAVIVGKRKADSGRINMVWKLASVEGGGR